MSGTREQNIGMELLAAMDEARNYDAASSYNWLRAELRRLRDRLSDGGTLIVEQAGRSIVLASPSEFDAWARRRYPNA